MFVEEIQMVELTNEDAEMPEGKTGSRTVITKGDKPIRFPPKPDYGGKPPGPRNVRPKPK